MSQFRLIGTSQTPKDLMAKITGRAKYAEDYRADGMIFAKLLLSPVPRGRVLGMDASRALAIPGVHLVLSGADLGQEGFGEPITTEIRYQGQPIAVAVADSEHLAAEALAAVRMNIERLPFALDPLESLIEGGPNPRDEGNRLAGQNIEDIKWTPAQMALFQGTRFPVEDLPGLLNENANISVRDIEDATLEDLNAVFAECAVVIEEPMYHQCQTHHPMEPRSAMAYWQNGTCYLHSSVQSVARVAAGLAGQLQVEPEQVVLISEFTGGGFGSKINGSPTDRLPAELSRRLNGRPVMLRVTRDEETYFGRARSGMQGWIKLGFRADGKVLAADVVLIQDGGPAGAPGDMGSFGGTMDRTITPEATRIRSMTIATNTPPRAAQRGPGGAQTIPMLATALERGARELGVDRADMMYLNATGLGDGTGANEHGMTSSFQKEAVLMARERFNWDEKRLLSGQRNGSKVTGVGLAMSPYTAGSRGMDGLMIIRPDGSVTIHSGVGNLGTHSVFDTAMAAAEVIGHPWDQVQVVWGNSASGLAWASSQSGSQTTHAHTRANYAAGQDAKTKLQQIAARDLGGNPADYDVANGRVFRRGAPATAMTLAQAARRAIQLGGAYDGHEKAAGLNAMTVATIDRHLVGQGLVAAARDNYGGTGAVQSTVVSMAVVEVDTETGVVEVKEMVSVGDVGTTLNPRSLAAQTSGGVYQGMSHARFESWAYDRRWGAQQRARLHDVKPFSILDIPATHVTASVNLADPQTPVGSRGIGEPPVGAGAGVIVSAVYDAIGRSISRTPLTPDRILNALEGGRTGYTLLQTHV